MTDSLLKGFDLKRRKARRYQVAALWVLAIGLVFSLFIWHITRQAVLDSETSRFAHQAEMIRMIVWERLNDDISALRGLRAFVDSSERVTRAEWQRYVSDLNADHFHGVIGFAYIRRVWREDLSRFLAETRADGVPEFEVRSSGNTPDLYIVEFIQPQPRNLPARGYDLGQDPAHRRFLAEAVENDRETLSNKLVHAEYESRPAGFLLVLPVYTQGMPTGTVAERWQAVRGWVGAPCSMDGLLADLVKYFDAPLDLEVLDVTPGEPATPLYAASSSLAPTDGSLATLFGSEEQNSQVTMEVAGRRWLLKVRALPGFTRPFEHHLPLVLLVAGVLLSALVSQRVAFYGRTLREAQFLAEKMTAELRQSAQRFHRMFQKHNAVMLLVEPQTGRIIEANDAASRFYGYSPEQLRTMSVDDVNTLPCEEVARCRQKVLAGELKQLEFQHRLASGEIRDVEVDSSPIVVDGRPALFSIVRDVTTEKAAAQALLEMDRMKNEFISTAAHELRTPLCAMMGYTELLCSPTSYGRFSEEQQQSFLHEIYGRGEALSRIIDDLLDISRIESGRPITLDLQPTDFAAVLAKAVDFYKFHDPEHVYRLDLQSGADAPLLLIDGQRISQVLENLLSNAAKYSLKGKAIVVTGLPETNGWEVRVEDQGIGMTPEQVARVFDKFYRVDATNTAIGGLGLGMSIVKQIIDAHGGRISIDSTPGQGTRVVFFLPARPPAPSA